MAKPTNLPSRYKGRTDVPYVPRGYSIDDVPELGDRICAALAVGTSLRQLCRQDGMPSMSTIFTWLRLDPAFAQNYTRAREHQAESYADEIADIADSAQGLDAAGVNAARLRVDARKWCASKLLPKRYGDKIDVNHQGGISVAAASAALKIVQPVTFDEEGNEIGTDDAGASDVPSAHSSEHLLTSVSAHPPPPGGSPGKGTPATMTARVTPIAQNPEIPSEIRQSFVEPSTLSDLL